MWWCCCSVVWVCLRSDGVFGWCLGLCFVRLGWVLTRYIDLYVLLCFVITVLFVPLVLGVFLGGVVVLVGCLGGLWCKCYFVDSVDLLCSGLYSGCLFCGGRCVGVVFNYCVLG